MNRATPVEIILVEDAGWEALRPLTWLRPAADLIVGARTIRERWENTPGCRVTLLCRPEVAALTPGRVGRLPEGEALRLWLRDRWLPDSSWAREALCSRRPVAWSNGGSMVAVLSEAAAPDGCEPGTDRFWESLASSASRGTVPRGSLLTELSDLARESSARLAEDLAEKLAATPPTTDYGHGNVYAPESIRLGEGCRIDHGAVLDAREGPIFLGAGTTVFPHTWIRGPFGCGERCLLLGGRLGASYLGAECRVRGEVNASTFHSYVNKAHDGYVGHSYMGEWVNLGALTTTSDLKNNYGMVRLEAYGRSVETGQEKLGSFIGDHAKTRIGAMLNSGSVVGLASNLFGDASVFPKWVPDFLWGAGPQATEYALDRCLSTVRTVLARRGCSCGSELERALEVAFRQSRSARDRLLSSAPPRRTPETTRG